MGDYCRKTGVGQISLGFQLANPVNFDINNYVLSGLKDNSSDGKAIRDPWEHLTKFFKTCLMCKPNEVTNDHVKLCFFGFSLIGSAKDWM